MKAQGVGAPAYASPLSRAPFDRQRDIYKLAKMGSGDCRRLWNDFAAEVPGIARLVVADVENERREDAEITAGIDKRLRSAEKLVTKTRRPKITKSAKKSAARVADDLAEYMAVLLDSCDPVTRERARAALESPHG